MRSTSTVKTVAIVNNHSPFSHLHGKEALDMALIFGAYEQTVSMFFIGDGVFQLQDQQNPQLINSKDYLKTFAALPFYDVEQLYVCQESLQQRQITQLLNLDNLTVLSATDLAKTLHQHDVIFRF